MEVIKKAHNLSSIDKERRYFLKRQAFIEDGVREGNPVHLT